LSTDLATHSEREYESGQQRNLGRRTEGTKVHVGVERQPARHLAVTMVACAAVAVLGILLVRFLSGPRTSTQDLETKGALMVSPPEDLTAASRQAGAPPADLTTVSVPTPAATNASSADTTGPAVREPAAVHEVRQAQPALPAKLRPTVRDIPIPAERVSEVELNSDPPGARLVVDSRSDLACLAPCNVSLQPGRHTLSAELIGYGVDRKIFNVPLEGSVFVTMARNMGVLVLTSEPAGTNVVVDGRDIGPTPVKVSLPAGRHHLSLTDGARHHEETIQIDTDGAYVRSFRW